jgi:hypothetical protein
MIIILLLLLLYYYYYYYYCTIIFIITIVSIIIIYILTIQINNCQIIFSLFRIVKNTTLSKIHYFINLTKLFLNLPNKPYCMCGSNTWLKAQVRFEFFFSSNKEEKIRSRKDKDEAWFLVLKDFTHGKMIILFLWWCDHLRG